MSEPAKLIADGEKYERLMGRWSRIVAEAFLKWLNAPKNSRWLDVGCGNGAFTEEVISRCDPAAVTGVDSSVDQLAHARIRPAASRVDFRVGDGTSDPSSMVPAKLFETEPDPLQNKSPDLRTASYCTAGRRPLAAVAVIILLHPSRTASLGCIAHQLAAISNIGNCRPTKSKSKGGW